MQAGQHPQIILSSQCVPSGQSDASIFGTHSTNEQSGHKGRLVVSQKLKILTKIDPHV